MADIKPPTEPPVAPPPPPPKPDAKPLPKQNPALKAMGLPRMRLPSRNWMIFIGVVSAWAGGIIYDRHQKQRAKDYWIKAVAPLAEVPLPTTTLPRKVTIYLQAPPGDTLYSAKEFFHEYVKPILNSAALDYDVVEIRREGGTWKTVRDAVWRTRRALNKSESTSGKGKTKAAAAVGVVDEEEEDPLEELRKRAGITREPGVGGELVIGRHVWKEWMHGLQDGWLTPLSEIPPKNLPPAEDETRPLDQEKYIEMALEGPQPEFYAAPVQAIPYPHMLGFLNTPWRIARYFNQRKVADAVGREVAKACFGFAKPGLDMDADLILKHEEKDWVSSVWEKAEVETTVDEKKKEPLKQKIEHLEEKVVEEIHHVEEKALEFVADGGLGSYSTPGVEAAREVLDNLKKADEQKLVERKSEEDKEAKKEAEKEKEKKEWKSPKIWQLPMKVDSRILEGLRSFELPLEAERTKEDYAKWW